MSAVRDDLTRPAGAARLAVWYLAESPVGGLLDILGERFDPRPLCVELLPPLGPGEAAVMVVDLDAGDSGTVARCAASSAGIPIIALADPAAVEHAGPVYYACLPKPVTPVVLATVLRNAGEHARVRCEADETRRQLEHLNAIGVRLSAERDPQALFQLILTKAREITDSDAGSIYLVEEPPDAAPRLRFALAQNDSVRVRFEERTLPISHDSVAGHVALAGEVLHLDDAYLLPPDSPYRINRDFDAQTGYRTKSMLVVPMKTPAGRVTGVLQLINHRGPESHWRRAAPPAGAGALPYPERYRSLAASLASQAAVALENSRLYQQIRTAYDELSRTQGQLTQAQKMEAIGRLAGGIAHDFNNLLMVVMGRSELLLRQIAPGDDRRAGIEAILETSRMAADLTRQLLAFSRKQVLKPAILDLNAVVSGVQRMLGRLIGENVALVAALEPSLARVKADPGQIEQVVMNLVINARDAMPSGGRLSIETRNVELDATVARREVGAPAGRYVSLAVRDTGVGMSEETRARIFEPFFTTKGPGRGTGLGLATVHGIVKQSGGHIGVTSQPGEGTTFTIYLPPVAEAGEAGAAGPALPHPARGSETILLVEDEDAVRELVRDILVAHGYTVLAARHGAEALSLCAQHPGPLPLMLTDLVMPHMSGVELARRTAPVRPAMKVIFMSGYADDATLTSGALDPGTVFLQKPMAPDVLGRKVREVLDASGSRPPQP